MSNFPARGQALLRSCQMTGAREDEGRDSGPLVGREVPRAEPPLARCRALGLRDIPACWGVQPGIGGPWVMSGRLSS